MFEIAFSSYWNERSFSRAFVFCEFWVVFGFVVLGFFGGVGARGFFFILFFNFP